MASGLHEEFSRDYKVEAASNKRFGLIVECGGRKQWSGIRQYRQPQRRPAAIEEQIDEGLPMLRKEHPGGIQNDWPFHAELQGLVDRDRDRSVFEGEGRV